MGQGMLPGEREVGSGVGEGWRWKGLDAGDEMEKLGHIPRQCSSACVFLFKDHHNELPALWWLKQYGFIILRVLDVGIQNGFHWAEIRCAQGCCMPSGGPRGGSVFFSQLLEAALCS